MPTRNYSSVAEKLKLTAGIGAADTTITTDKDAPGWPFFPAVAAIERGTSNEELVLITGTPAVNQFTVTRGFDDTTAKTHPNGAAVEHVTSAADFREAQSRLDQLEAWDTTDLGLRVSTDPPSTYPHGMSMCTMDGTGLDSGAASGATTHVITDKRSDMYIHQTASERDSTPEGDERMYYRIGYELAGTSVAPFWGPWSQIAAGIPSASSTPNTLAQRDTAGDIRMRLVRSEYASGNSFDLANAIMTQRDFGGTADNYVRPTSLAHVKKALDTRSSFGGTASPNKFRDLAVGGSNLSTFAGSIVIKTNYPGRNNMQITKISIYSYDPGFVMSELWISGYWRNKASIPTAEFYTSAVMERGNMPVAVRTGFDPAGNIVIVLDNSRSWKYPKISVDEWLVGYGSLVDGDTNWSIESNITDFTGYVLSPTITATEA